MATNPEELDFEEERALAEEERVFEETKKIRNDEVSLGLEFVLETPKYRARLMDSLKNGTGNDRASVLRTIGIDGLERLEDIISKERGEQDIENTDEVNTDLNDDSELFDATIKIEDQDSHDLSLPGNQKELDAFREMAKNDNFYNLGEDSKELSKELDNIEEEYLTLETVEAKRNKTLRNIEADPKKIVNHLVKLTSEMKEPANREEFRVFNGLTYNEALIYATEYVKLLAEQKKKENENEIEAIQVAEQNPEKAFQSNVGGVPNVENEATTKDYNEALILRQEKWRNYSKERKFYILVQLSEGALKDEDKFQDLLAFTKLKEEKLHDFLELRSEQLKNTTPTIDINNLSPESADYVQSVLDGEDYDKKSRLYYQTGGNNKSEIEQALSQYYSKQPQETENIAPNTNIVEPELSLEENLTNEEEIEATPEKKGFFKKIFGKKEELKDEPANYELTSEKTTYERRYLLNRNASEVNQITLKRSIVRSNKLTDEKVLRVLTAGYQLKNFKELINFEDNTFDGKNFSVYTGGAGYGRKDKQLYAEKLKLSGHEEKKLKKGLTRKRRIKKTILSILKKEANKLSEWEKTHEQLKKDIKVRNAKSEEGKNTEVYKKTNAISRMFENKGF